jgi:hypothetical protein
MSTQLSDNSKLIAKFNIVDIYERNLLRFVINCKKYNLCQIKHQILQILTMTPCPQCLSVSSPRASFTKNLRDLRNLREIKKSSVRKVSQISQIHTDEESKKIRAIR